MKKYLLIIALIAFISNYDAAKANPWNKAVGPNLISVTSFLILDNDVILATTSKHVKEVLPPNGIIKSTDGGTTWSAIKDSVLSSVSTFGLLKKKNGNLLCGADEVGLMESTDNGETWTNICPNIGLFEGIIEANNGNILTNFWSNTQISVDSGKTFKKIPELGGTWGFKINSTGDLFALADKKGVWKSTDNGLTWADISGETLNDKNCRALYIDSKDNIWVSTWKSFYFSSDGGSTWRMRDNGLDEFNISPKGHEIREDPKTGKMYLGFRMMGGIMAYDSSHSKWVRFSPSMPQKTVAAIAFTPSGRMLVGDENHGVGYTDDNGETWNLPKYGFGESMIYELAAYQDELYVGTGDGLVFKSVGEDGEFNPILFQTDISEQFVMSLTVTNNGTILLGRSSGDFDRSTDKGATWTDLNPDANFLPETFLVDGNTIYAGARGPGGRGVFISKDDGLTWQGDTGVVAGKNIFSIGKNSNGDIFAGSARQGLFKKPFETGIWEKLDFPDSLFTYGIISDSKGTLFVGTGDGFIYKSTDNGSTFLIITSDIGVNAMAIVDSVNHIYKDDIFLATANKCAFIDHVNNIATDLSENFVGKYTRAILYQPEHRRIYAGGMFGGLQWYDLTVASADEPERGSALISPNPASDFISIVGFAEVGQRIEIISQLGTKVLDFVSRDERIDISRLPVGVYYVKCGEKVGKFVKM